MRNYLYIFFDWSVVLISYYIFYISMNLFTFLVLIIVLASRQHAFFANQHEASHGHLSNNPTLNEWISTLFCSFPMGHNYFYFKQYHLMHHRFLNTDLDPSYVPIKNDPDWVYPMKKSHFYKLLIKDLMGINHKIMTVYETLYSRHSNSYRYYLDRFGFYPCLFAALYLVSGNIKFSMLSVLAWFIAKYTLLILLIRLRTIVEHSGPIEHDGGSRDIEGSVLEKLFIIPHHVGYHLQHHLYPGTPAYKINKENCDNLNLRIFGRNGLLNKLLY